MAGPQTPLTRVPPLHMPTGPHLNLPNDPTKPSVPSRDALVYPIESFIMMIIDVFTNLISQSASMAGLQLLESGSPLSATWPRNHLDWLILFSSIVVSIFISQYSTVPPGRTLLDTCLLRLSNWPSLKEYWNTQGKGGDETKGKLVAIQQRLNMFAQKAAATVSIAFSNTNNMVEMFAQKVAATVSIVVSPTKSMVEMFAQAVSKHIKRSRSEWPKVIKGLCNLATWWALFYLPTSVAAYELKSEDDVTGYGPILVGAAPVGAALFMFILLALKVRHSVRGHMNSLVNSGRRLLENLSFGVLVTGLLVATVILLVLAFPHIYEFKGDVCVSELIFTGFAPISVALIISIPGPCHKCGKPGCGGCSSGSGTGTGQESN